MFTTLHNLAPKIRRSRAVPLLPLYAFTARIQVTKAVIFKVSTIYCNSMQHLCFAHLALWVPVIARVITMRGHAALLSAGNL
jgi:hypothetical protein